MLPLQPRLIFLIVITSLIGLLLWKDREKVQRHSILFYRRTEKGIKYIDKIAKISPRFWNIYGWTGVLLALISIPLVLYQILISFSVMLSTKSTQGGPAFIAPGLGSQAKFQSGVSFIPAEAWVLGIGVLMVVHELSHGIIARTEDFEINSVGWVIFGIIPGAFVEPKGENMLPEKGETIEDVKQKADNQGLWDQGDWKSRLKVLSAGSFANYLTGFIIIVIALGIFTNVTQPAGVPYVAFEEQPAIKAGLDNGTLYAVNGERVRYTEEVLKIGDSIEPNETVTLWTSEGNFTVVTASINGSEKGYIGVGMPRMKGFLPSISAMINNSRLIKPNYSQYKGILEWIITTLELVALLNLIVGFFNMLPAKPLDGGQVVDTFLERFSPNLRPYLNYWSLAIWLALILSLVISIGAGLI